MKAKAISNRKRGVGPIGLAAILTARLFSPSHIVSIDVADTRLEATRTFGADNVVNAGTQSKRSVIDGLTGGLGAEPIKALEKELGLLALQLLIAGLAITPARRYLRLNLIKFRRALGL